VCACLRCCSSSSSVLPLLLLLCVECVGSRVYACAGAAVAAAVEAVAEPKVLPLLLVLVLLCVECVCVHLCVCATTSVLIPLVLPLLLLLCGGCACLKLLLRSVSLLCVESGGVAQQSWEAASCINNVMCLLF
jgi:hypothetical protein